MGAGTNDVLCGQESSNVSEPTQPQSGMSEAEQPKVGLIAGWGRYPLVVADTLRRQGYRTYCLGAKDHADPVLAELCYDFRWMGVAQLGKAIRYFRQNDVRQITMAGKINKVIILRPWVLLRHLPDWRAIRRFYPSFLLTRKDRNDDTLLRGIVDEFALDGITFSPATDFCPELLVRSGNLTSRGPSRAQRRDIEFGWTLAKELGRLDIGQSVVVKDRAAVAVEAIEGTDECIRRAGRLCPNGGLTLVKVAKPQQDMRFDVPTIGMGTLRAMVESGVRVLAVEAGRTILLDEPQAIDFANRHQLVVVALNPAQEAESEGEASLGRRSAA